MQKNGYDSVSDRMRLKLQKAMVISELSATGTWLFPQEVTIKTQELGLKGETLCGFHQYAFGAYKGIGRRVPPPRMQQQVQGVHMQTAYTTQGSK